jgi:hypothetical protein
VEMYYIFRRSMETSENGSQRQRINIKVNKFVNIHKGKFMNWCLEVLNSFKHIHIICDTLQYFNIE